MKLFILTILIIAGILFIKDVSNYDERMGQYNKHVCAVNGYQADCKTPLAESERLK